MTRYISSKAPVSTRSLKRRPLGAVVRHHSKWEDVKFTRVKGGWLREREDFAGLSPVVVSSAATAAECNRSVGCSESWASVY